MAQRPTTAEHVALKNQLATMQAQLDKAEAAAEESQVTISDLKNEASMPPELGDEHLADQAAMQEALQDSQDRIQELEATATHTGAALRKHTDAAAKKAEDSETLSAYKAGLIRNYGFYKSAHPNCTFILGEGTPVVFEAQSKITSRDPTTGLVASEDSWGLFYTRSPEIKELLDLTCKTNPLISRLSEEEVDNVVTSICESRSII